MPCLLSGRILFWNDLLVAGKVVSWERWEGSKLGKWERWEGSELASWERWLGGKGGRVESWQCGRLLVLYKVRGCRVSPRFYFFVSDVNK